VWPGKDYYNPTVAPMGDILINKEVEEEGTKVR
jgi:hypothetical protein